MKISLETVFGIVIGAIFVVIIGFVIASVIRSQLPEEIDDATLSSFDEIVSAIKTLETEDKFDKEIAVDIRKPFYIVGFSKGEHVKGFEGMEVLDRNIDNLGNPCLGNPCLCVCPSIFPFSGLGDNDCFKSNAKCVEFDNLDLYGSDELNKHFVLIYRDKPHTIVLSGSKEAKSVYVSLKVE